MRLNTKTMYLESNNKSRPTRFGWKDEFLVRYNNKFGDKQLKQGIIPLGKELCLPTEYIGKKVKLKLEIIE